MISRKRTLCSAALAVSACVIDSNSSIYVDALASFSQPRSTTSRWPRYATRTFSSRESNRQTSLMANSPYLSNDESLHARGQQRDNKSSTWLPAVAVAAPTDFYGYEQTNNPATAELMGKMKDMLLPVLSASLLITGNTVGASCLVLPELASQVGMGLTSLIFSGAYLMNLISGLVIAEVAIRQHESGNTVPSSFKEFAQANLESDWAANFVSSISLMVNACIMSFNLVRAGQVLGGQVFGLDFMDGTLSAAAAAALVYLLSTQPVSKLSSFASMTVTGLLVAFGGMLLPNLATVAASGDAFASSNIMTMPSLSDETMAAIGQVAPVFLTTSIYQNIVPSVTRLLKYDRTKTMLSLGLGSMIPIAMYWTWCFTSLAMNCACADDPSALSAMTCNPLWSLGFSLTALVGSSIGCSMCLSEELDSFFKPKANGQVDAIPAKSDHFSLPSVLLSLGVPLMLGLTVASGENFTTTLKVAGSYGSPLLYGVLPAIMAWKQRQKASPSMPSQNLVPGGQFSLGMLGTASAGFMLQELAGSDMLNSVMAMT